MSEPTTKDTGAAKRPVVISAELHQQLKLLAVMRQVSLREMVEAKLGELVAQLEVAE